MYNPGLISLLSEILGFPKSSSKGKADLEFNCPYCDEGKNKFNLFIKLDSMIFHCWACGFKGKVHRLLNKFGSDRQREEFKLISPDNVRPVQKQKEEKPQEIISLSSFRSLKYKWPNSLNYIAAIKYLKQRNIDQELIERWDICYSEEGKYKNRIIIPSRSLDGKLEYFVSRDFYGTSKQKYLNPRIDKENLIFGEKFIDWNKPIILTEGVFDAIVCYNAIPILGTNLKVYKRLVKKLIQNKSTVILGFDADKTGKEKEIKVARFLISIGCNVYILPKSKYNEFNDLSQIYNNSGRTGIVTLIKSAQPFDELDAAIATL